jgi:hypothetical protein
VSKLIGPLQPFEAMRMRETFQQIYQAPDMSITTVLTNRKQESSLANILATFVDQVNL